MSYLPFLPRSRGGAFAAGPAAPAVDTGVSEQDILDMSPIWWLDADQQYCLEAADDVCEDGDSCIQWNDKSGNDSNFDDTNAGYSPLWYESGENSLPYVYFNSDRMHNTPDATRSTPGTFYVVMSLDATGSNGQWIFYNGVGGLITRTGTIAGSLLASSTGEKKWGTFQSTDTRIYQIKLGGASGPHELRINGGAAESSISDTGSLADKNLTTATTNSFKFSSSLIGKCYEFLFIHNITHDGDKVFQHFGDKYAITVTDIE